MSTVDERGPETSASVVTRFGSVPETTASEEQVFQREIFPLFLQVSSHLWRRYTQFLVTAKYP